MKLTLPQVKDKIIMCRFPEEVYTAIGKTAQEHETSKSAIVRALITEAYRKLKRSN